MGNRTKNKFKKGQQIRHRDLDLQGTVLGYDKDRPKHVNVLWGDNYGIGILWNKDGLSLKCRDPEEHLVLLSKLHQVLK